MLAHPPPSAPDAPQHASPIELQAQVNQARGRAMHEMLPPSLLFGVLTAAGCVLVLWSRLPHLGLLIWMALRVLISLIRLGHTLAALRPGHAHTPRQLIEYRVLSMMDGLTWGALGWALTPVMQLDVAIVSVGVLIGVAALGTFMLHVDLASAVLFITPVLFPNSLLAMSRGDELGWFCAVAVFGLMCALLLEAMRSNRRILELLRLRFQQEEVTRAQAKALQQAEQLAETKSRFMATMSHEMRTPLHGILGLVRLLRQREADPHALRQLDLIRGTGDHLVNVINDVLDYSRMEAGSLPLHAQAFNLRELLLEVAETSRVSASDKGLSLATQLDLPAKQELQGDPIRIRQVMHNLLGNAIKFTTTGQVRLHAWRDANSGRTTIEVHDSGIGIPPEEQTRIFDAFHQAEGTYQRRFGGTGLGLTISRDLCRAMGGDLHCRSQVGQGSVFTFTLPLPPAQAAAAPTADQAEGRARAQEDARAGPPVDASAPRVLLVEDNPVNAIVAEAELRNMGLEVALARNGRQALEWLAQQRADLVLMDCEMPEMDGFEATRQIRQLEQARGQGPVRIVALTANGLDTHLHRCREAGMDDHLAKPFRPEELARTVRRHLPRAVATH